MTLYADRNDVKLFILSNGDFSLKVYENGSVEYDYKFNSEELETALTAWAMYQLDDPFWINYVKDFGVNVLEFPILKRLLIV
tara:strand:+ start:231 stop:476 length:246 start_codon:yes stop_codon:yes gene_type:complete